MEAWNIFKDRKDAGEQLGKDLLTYKAENPIIVGIPRGGVEVAYYVAKALHCELSIIISKKIPHPLHPEYGIGAITEKDMVYISERTSIDVNVIESIIHQLKQEILRRILIYRKDNPFPEMKDKTVILVDDGIATGVTMVPAIRLCRKLLAKKIIVAVPVSPKNINPDLQEADEIIILHQPILFHSVGRFYENFNQLNNQDVMHFLKNN